jgi:hypothetical protein
MLPLRECELCKEPFRARMKSRFCSMKCAELHRRKLPDAICPTCQTKFRRTHSARRFCSQVCYLQDARQPTVITREVLLAIWNRRVRKGQPDECWSWTGPKLAGGYGRLSFQGIIDLAHRLTYLLFIGHIPDDCVLHRCDNPACCNPAHLFAGTHKDNTHDMINKGRDGFAAWPRGRKQDAPRDSYGRWTS